MEHFTVERINNKKYLHLGFTLIELLVVISIIAVLSVIGLVSYSTFLKSSRDNRRLADLKFIQSSLEEYHSDNLAYPFTVTPGTPIVNGGKTYMSQVPNDPALNPNYSYVASGTSCAAATPQNCTSYCLYAKIEGTNIPASDSVCTPTSPYNYGISRP